jgi:flavin-dependent dehydrogenase
VTGVLLSDREDGTKVRECDVVVVGGGPGGSSAAAWLARAGRRVALFERDQFPRFHIGESLLSSVNDALDAIGADGLVRNAGFPPKWGATFMLADGANERYADFSIASGVRAPQTWQVPRATFDHLLLKHAADSGALVHERHRVHEVQFDGDGVTLTVQGPDGDRWPVRAKAIIDASGRAGLLSRKFSLRVDEPRLQNVAIFSHYSGVPRPSGRRSGDIRIVACQNLGWFWIIPISETLTSVGVVLPQAAIKAIPSLEPAALLERMIADTPAVARLLDAATREWPVRVEKDYSFSSRAYAGDRWVLVGDAGSFLDPMFSTGVAIALESAVEGAQAVEKGLATGDLSARRFALFSRRQLRRYRSFRRFVIAFYTPEFRDLFFTALPPLEIFRSLVTIFAGYWHPSFRTRAWVRAFFLLVRLQRYVPIAAPVVSNPDRVRARKAVA